jgi:DNA-binding CsgD family transcriptional regulator
MLTADLMTSDPPALRHLPGYLGPERRLRPERGERLGRWLALMLEEMAHGVLLVTADGLLCHANQPARDELAAAGTLVLLHGRVGPARADELARLQVALQEAAAGRRRLFSLGGGDRPLTVAAVPLPPARPGDDPLVLLVLGRRTHVEALTIDFYARTQGLTGAEANVLRGLCRGLRPKEVARDCGVAVSTVRTQISSIRQKTHSQSIRALLERVAALPPITSLIRPGTATAH